jgi:selenocysteine lyase/cysteine desulfurase
VVRLRDAGHELRIADRRDRRSGIVMVRVPDSAASVASLAEKGIVVDKRGEYVRVSPHFYNTVEENARCVAALR